MKRNNICLFGDKFIKNNKNKCKNDNERKKTKVKRPLFL